MEKRAWDYVLNTDGEKAKQQLLKKLRLRRAKAI